MNNISCFREKKIKFITEEENQTIEIGKTAVDYGFLKNLHEN